MLSVATRAFFVPFASCCGGKRHAWWCMIVAVHLCDSHQKAAEVYAHAGVVRAVGSQVHGGRAGIGRLVGIATGTAS